MIRNIFSSTSELVPKKKGSEGCCPWRQVHNVKGDKSVRKVKKNKGGTRSSSRPKKKLEQSNLNGVLVQSLDVEGFGDHFQVHHSSDVTRVGFQNCGP